MRRLTEQEVTVFQTSHPDITYYSIPPWGDVVRQENGTRLLLYFGSGQKLFITDITDRPDLLTNISTETFNPYNGLWWYHVPEELSKSVINAYNSVADTVNQLPNLLEPNALVPLAIIAVVIAFVMFKR